MTVTLAPKAGLALAAAALLLAGCSGGGDTGNATANAADAAGAAAIAPPAGSDWTTTVSETPEGGFVMGNPNAPVKVVEYLSITCSHCAAFAAEGFPTLRDTYIKKGTVSLEVRNYVRDPIDVTAALITRCNGPAPYFQLTEQVLAAQAGIFEKAQAVPQAEFQKIGAMQPAEQFKTLSKMVGLDQFARQRGIGEQKAEACLGDKAALDKLVAMQKYANDEIKLQGTPTFILNGNMLQNTGTWDQLEPALKAAGA